MNVIYAYVVLRIFWSGQNDNMFGWLLNIIIACVVGLNVNITM